jgi:hypothetical protein
VALTKKEKETIVNYAVNLDEKIRKEILLNGFFEINLCRDANLHTSKTTVYYIFEDRFDLLDL